MTATQQRVVLVTGGMGGLGETISTKMADAGYRVVVTYSPGNTKYDEWLADLKTRGYDMVAVPCDVASFDSCSSAVADIQTRLGAIDVLVNNAGIGSFGRADELPIEAWERVLAINLGAAFHGSRAALRHLRARHGCIVNTASISGLFADPGLLAYNVSKAGVVNLTRNMAVDHAAEGIRVNCICPGPVGTPMLSPLLADPGVAAQYAELIPLGRVGTAEEMAAGILFLASRDAAFMTGTAIVIDGGVTCQTGQPNLDRILRAIVAPGSGG